MTQKLLMNSPIGLLELVRDEAGLSEINFKKRGKASRTKDELLLQAKRELTEYFARKRTAFSVPLSIEGTPFQKEVWRSLVEIPFGKTSTYKEVAQRIKNPKAVRAVGGANNKNPIPIILPCHRVIGANGKLVGYGGGVKIKEALLKLEKSSN